MPQRTYSVLLRRAAAVWLVVSAVASLYYAVCVAAPQLTSHNLAPMVTCLTPAYRLHECVEAEFRASLEQQHQQERRRGVQGMLVWGSMLIVGAVLLRCGRQRAVA